MNYFVPPARGREKMPGAPADDLSQLCELMLACSPRDARCWSYVINGHFGGLLENYPSLREWGSATIYLNIIVNGSDRQFVRLTWHSALFAFILLNMLANFPNLADYQDQIPPTCRLTKRIEYGYRRVLPRAYNALKMLYGQCLPHDLKVVRTYLDAAAAKRMFAEGANQETC